MGIFNRRKVEAIVEDPVDASFLTGEIDYLSEQLQDEGVQLQLMAMATFLSILLALRMMSKSLVKGLGGEHVLSIHGKIQHYVGARHSLLHSHSHPHSLFRPE
jgi:hypothetical protein